jgi:hypothetical protein
MKTAKKKGSSESGKGTKKMVLAFQDGPFDVHPEIGRGRMFSCINLKIDNHGELGDKEKRYREVEITLSYYQAQALAEILENFVNSKNCHRKAQTPVHVSSGGGIRWSTFLYLP